MGGGLCRPAARPHPAGGAPRSAVPQEPGQPLVPAGEGHLAGPVPQWMLVAGCLLGGRGWLGHCSEHSLKQQVPQGCEQSWPPSPIRDTQGRGPGVKTTDRNESAEAPWVPGLLGWGTQCEKLWWGGRLPASRGLQAVGAATPSGSPSLARGWLWVLLNLDLDCTGPWLGWGPQQAALRRELCRADMEAGVSVSRVWFCAGSRCQPPAHRPCSRSSSGVPRDVSPGQACVLCRARR